MVVSALSLVLFITDTANGCVTAGLELLAGADELCAVDLAGVVLGTGVLLGAELADELVGVVLTVLELVALVEGDTRAPLVVDAAATAGAFRPLG